MALHPHVDVFYRDWLRKADDYHGHSLSCYFNKAFSLFTLYNKLYAEATFELARNGKIKLGKRFPDFKGAVEYAPKYIGYDNLLDQLTSDYKCSREIETLVDLIEQERFYIKLSMPYGYSQRNEDLKLLKEIQSADSEKRVRAILELIYSVRCNMFHGSKSFQEVQVELLEPVTVILRKVIEVLYQKLSGSERSFEE